MNDAPNAAAEPAVGEASSEETPTVDSSSSTNPSGRNEAVLVVGASISRGMSNVRGKMQLLGRDDISSPFSSQRGAVTQKAYKEQKTDKARASIEPPNASTTSNGAYPAAKMQMSSGRTQKAITDPEDVPPVCKGDSRDRGEMQQSRSENAEPRDFSSSASATGENISNTFDALHRTEADVFSRPGAFLVVPGLPPIPAGDVSIEGETDVTQGEANPLTPARLDLEDNRLEGTVPLELSNMTSLEAFVAAKNLLNGTIPTELGLLSTLMLLRIHNNKFEGSLPTTLGLLRKIELFYADSNSFTGSLPTHMGRMSNLKGLIVGQNQLSGTLPSELGGLHQLEVANMGHNINIRGTIPSHLGLLVSLQQLHLDMTSVSGTIPSEL
jgi:hypothetical protein